MTQKPNQGFWFEHRIGVQRHDDFGRCTLQAEIQCRPFAAIGLCYDADTVVGCEFCSHDVRRTVGRTIIDDQDIERLSVARLQHRADRAVDDFGFVVRRDQNGDGLRLPSERAAALFAQEMPQAPRDNRADLKMPRMMPATNNAAITRQKTVKSLKLHLFIVAAVRSSLAMVGMKALRGSPTSSCTVSKRYPRR